MLRKILMAALAFACCVPVMAQQALMVKTAVVADSLAKVGPELTTAAAPAPAPVPGLPFGLTISADAYYRYEFNRQASNNKTSFTNSHNSFELGMASIKVDHTFGKVGVVADLGFGKRAEDFSYNDENTRFVIKQLFMTFAPTDKLKFTAGSFATHVGYELVDAYMNRNYSMSYMFSYGPFFHTGLKADYTLGRSGFMLGITNPTDLKSTDFGPRFVIGQYSLAITDDTKMYVNYQGGRTNDTTKVNQFDLVLSHAFSSKFSVGYNGSIQSANQKLDGKFGGSLSWWGSALYVNVDPSKLFGLTLRGEFFSDDNALNIYSAYISPRGFAEGGNVFSTTLSANFRIDNLTIIPEFRLDQASKAIFSDGDGSPIRSSPSLLLAAVYKF